MRKEHSKEYIAFTEKCDKLGHAPTIRSFATGLLIPNEEGDLSVVRALPGDNPSFTFVMSTAGVKRDGHEIIQAGWHLENYRRNPVFLWCHDRCSPPIGTVPDIGLKAVRGFGQSLVGTVVFDEEDDFAEMIASKYARGILSATSCGWNPIEYEAIVDSDGYFTGYRFIEQELMEDSAVPVPADPDALKREIMGGQISQRFIEKFALNSIFRNDNGSDDIFWLGLEREDRSAKIYSIPSEQIETETKEALTMEDVRTAPAIDEPGGEKTEIVADVVNEETRDAVEYDEHGDMDCMDDETPWNMVRVRERVAKFAAGADGIDWKKYRKAFMYVDTKRASEPDGYLGLHHDVIDGKMVMVPRAVKRVAQRLERGEYDISEGAKAQCKKHLSREAAKFDWTPPWDREVYSVLYRNTLEALANENLGEGTIRDGLQAQAVNLAIELFGEDRMPESWENDSNNVIDSISRHLTGNVEDREARAQLIFGEIRRIYDKPDRAMTLVRQIFEITGIENSDDLIRWLQSKVDEDEMIITNTASVSEDILERANNLLTRLDKFDNNDEKSDNENMEGYDSLMERLNKLIPVAG